MNGTLMRLKMVNKFPAMELLAIPGIEIEEAKSIAIQEVSKPDWVGPRQFIFMHQDWSVEVWDIELR